MNSSGEGGAGESPEKKLVIDSLSISDSELNIMTPLLAEPRSTALPAAAMHDIGKQEGVCQVKSIKSNGFTP